MEYRHFNEIDHQPISTLFKYIPSSLHLGITFGFEMANDQNPSGKFMKALTKISTVN